MVAGCSVTSDLSDPRFNSTESWASLIVLNFSFLSQATLNIVIGSRRVYSFQVLNFGGAVVVAKLVERSLLTPEICGSNPDIGKISSTNCAIEKTKTKKKRPGVAHLYLLNFGPVFTHC